jgi:hypothetical protein
VSRNAARSSRSRATKSIGSRSALDAAGLSSRRLYDLRHSFASNALVAGISLYELSRYRGASVRVL